MKEDELSLSVSVHQRSPTPDRFGGLLLSSPGSLHSSPLGPTVIVMETETDTVSETSDSTSLSTVSSYQSLQSLLGSLGSLDSLTASEPDQGGYEADISSNEDVFCD